MDHPIDESELELDGEAQVTLPTVLLAPLPELAASARANQRLRDVRRVADWAVGRKVTKAGSLTLADARKAVVELRLPGDQGPGRTPARTAAEFPELTELWEYAVGAELVRPTPPAARPGPALVELEDDDHEVRQIWIDLFGSALDRWFDTPPLDLGLIPALLGVYLEPAGVSVSDLVADAIEHHVESFRPEQRETVSGNVAEVTDPLFRELLSSLASLGAVDVEGEQVRITPLGTFGLSHWFESVGLDAPAVESLSEASAMQLLELGRDFDGPEELQEFFGEWVSARGEQSAAEQLAELARQGDPDQRSTAFALLDQIGDAAGPAVHLLLDEPSLYAQAAVWLSLRGLEGPEPTPAEMQWGTVEALADLLELDTAELDTVLGSVTAQGEGGELTSMLEQIGASDHPQTVAVLELLAEHHPDPGVARTARKSALRARSSR